MGIGEETLELLSHSKNYNQWLFERIRPHLGDKILEVGGGIGTFTAMLLEDNRSVTVVDINKDYLKKLRKRFPSQKPKIIHGDIQNLALKGFDTVFCFNVLEHLENDNKSIKNMFKSLKGRGMLLLLVPAHQILFGSLDESLDHKRRYNKKKIVILLKSSGFKIKKISYLNMLGALGWLTNSKFLKRKIIPSKQFPIFDKMVLPFLFLENFFSPPFGLSILAIAEKK